MADDFVESVEAGLKLAKRIYFGKDRSVTAPKPVEMEKYPNSYLPTAPIVYAVISDPAIVDNPDIPSYQPHVYGRCDPPALIPLQMNEIAMEVDCYLDTAFVSVSGSWWVHCVTGGRRCDCRLAIPMGEQGSILGVDVDVDVTRRSYSTQLITMEEKGDMVKVAKAEDGGLLKPQIFTLTIPQVVAGSNLVIKVSWSQKLLYKASQFSLNVPFSFPDYVAPAGRSNFKREKIRLNVNSGIGTEVFCKTTSHPLKEIGRQVGRLDFSYEADVITWSNTDFKFSYTVSSSDISGVLLLQSPLAHDFDQREMFCLYLVPGDNQSRKVFKKDVVFLVDISGSMQGGPLESVKNAISASLFELNPEDSFCIIAFNGETHLFSLSMELATHEMIESAIQWMSINLIAEGGTNILLPLNQAIEMLSNTCNSIPLIFLITDGAVEDEKHICNVIEGYLTNGGSISPRISTFGIGTYCNHYFLQMLALIGKGHFDVAHDPDSIDLRMQRLITTASSAILANITIDSLKHLDSLEVYPCHIPDLLSGSPLTVSGRYKGNFPGSLKAGGILADMSNFVIDVKVQRAKGIPLEKVVARHQIDLLTSQAWLLESKQLEEKVAKMSIQSSIPSEYTRMILLLTDRRNEASESVGMQEVSQKIDLQKLVDSEGQRIILVRRLGFGFGNLIATAENIPPAFGEPSLSDPAANALVKAASNCCGKLGDCWCCVYFIQVCSQMNDRCAVALTQLCTALACFGCLSLCADVCCD